MGAPFHEKPNFRSNFQCHFSYWISFSDSNLILMISQPPPHRSPYPAVFVVVVDAEEPNPQESGYQGKGPTQACSCEGSTGC
jgi:hypothetical protein